MIDMENIEDYLRVLSVPILSYKITISLGKKILFNINPLGGNSFFDCIAFFDGDLGHSLKYIVKIVYHENEIKETIHVNKKEGNRYKDENRIETDLVKKILRIINDLADPYI